LPGRFGIGDLGEAAYRFADFLQRAGQSIWQVLPLGPTGYGDSPYQCFSAFAGNPLLISLEKLVERGDLCPDDLADVPDFPRDVDYGRVIQFRLPLLRRAAARFYERARGEERRAYDEFCRNQGWWLDDYARFMTLKEVNGGELVWTEWTRQDAGAGDWHKFVQFEFFRQWGDLRRYCHELGIRIMGDMPIYVAHDSADVWAHRDLFQLDSRGMPVVVAGVPPDYFSATGQLWGNPIYRWEVMAARGYDWWIDRFRATLAAVDIVRLDHFRGFQAYWEVAAGESTAISGRWVEGPGATLFEAAQASLGELPIVAENLGVITPEVEAIRQQFGFPGMAILQFAFGKDPQAPTFQPHNYPRDVVAYSGTHDNDTTVGWWTSAGEGDSTRTAADVAREKAFARRYLNSDGTEINWVLMRTLMASVATTVLFPLQDVLGLGSKARMNRPAIASGNWRWRFAPEMLSSSIEARLRELAETYDRLP
jgi:4-alpha-glucanotransferase